MQITINEMNGIKKYMDNINFEYFYNHVVENDKNDFLNNIHDDFKSLINQFVYDYVIFDFDFGKIDIDYYKMEIVKIINGRKNDLIVT